MPRSSRTDKFKFDPEIEKTARRLRKETKQLKGEASTSSESEADLALDMPTSNDFEEEVMAQNSERTINEMTSLNLNQQPLCIEYPTLDVDFELKSGFIHLFPSFRGLAGDDPHKHLKKFHVVCSSMKPQGVTDENDNPPRKVNEVSASINERLDELTSLVKKIVVGGPQQVKTYGICTSRGYFTDACPTLHEEPTEHVNAVGGYSGPSQRGYDPFSKTYNPGWRDHPNLRYDNQSQNFQKPSPPPQSNPNSGHSDVHSKLGESNPCEHSKFGVSSEPISLLRQSFGIPRSWHAQKIRIENSVVRGHAEQGKTGEELEIPPKQAEKPDLTSEEHPKVFVPKPPFLERFAKSKKEEEEKDILETLRKVEVNISLLNAIKQVPRYAKFLKEMCINKSKLRGNELVSMGENDSIVLQSKQPPKCKDPGTFSIPCRIGKIGIENALCDLGASINVMSLAIYESLNIGPLEETGVVLQLADRSIVYPEGVLEDVLVQVNELVFPTDFYVLDMIEDNSPNSTSILLGRPFLKTSKTKIDVDAVILSMEFDNEVVSFLH
ncbi:UNVERIFIED_CONTAM: hypothetical protein Slati_3451200 [Sesamum latifolium]|uniref:Retrotransposon gag protein n=1 Tax=Sesamum latifolium TaxID=2727402 RepID=A0AAW2UHY1_9LAMI